MSRPQSNKPAKVRFSMFIDPDLMAYISAQADRLDLTQAEIIRKAVVLHRDKSAERGHIDLNPYAL